MNYSSASPGNHYGGPPGSGSGPGPGPGTPIMPSPQGNIASPGESGHQFLNKTNNKPGAFQVRLGPILPQVIEWERPTLADEVFIFLLAMPFSLVANTRFVIADSAGPGGDGMYSMMKPVGPGGQLPGVCLPLAN